MKTCSTENDLRSEIWKVIAEAKGLLARLSSNIGKRNGREIG